MHKTIISDTSCFIILSNIHELELLHKVYGKVLTTHEISTEFGEALPEWVQIETVKDKYRLQLLEILIDKGESIALALETPESVIILDDYKARKIAVQLGLIITGTIDVIVKAKIKGIIPSIKPFLEKIQLTNFRLTEDNVSQALKEANE